MTEQMTGAESLLRTLAAAGIELCFANPGTSEMHFLTALDRVDGIRPVLGLFEGVVTGMADGYARIAGKPAVTLLHLGSGLANGIANLHNARRAASPIVNIVGDHATHHRQWDTPLASDIEALARPVSAWVHSCRDARNAAADGARAVAAALEPPGRIATLILPADAAWGPADDTVAPLPRPAPVTVADATIDRVAAILKARGSRSMILARGAVLDRRGQTALGRIAARSGARLAYDLLTPRIERGAGSVPLERLPYRAEDIVRSLAGLTDLILIGTHAPVAAFAYPDYPSWCVGADTAITYLAHEHEDGVSAAEALAEALGAPPRPARLTPLDRPGRLPDILDQHGIGAVIARHLPDGAIVSDEAASNGFGPFVATAGAAPHIHLVNTGGAIGQGMPVAAGAALAAPGAKIVNLQADGSAMYTIQALWTQARERLDVVTVILANRSYAILRQEFTRVGVTDPGPRALAMLDLGDPAPDWVKLAEGMGVEASRATTVKAFDAQFADAMRTRGPRLIEVVL